MKKNSLTVKTIMDLSLFSVIILLLLWLVQIQFLSVFYERYQMDKIKNVVDTINSSNAIKPAKLEDLSFQNNICIQYYHNGTIDNYNIKNSGCILNSNSNSVVDIKNKLLNEDNDYFKLEGPNGAKSIIYIIKLNSSSYIYLNTPLEDLNSTTSLLKSQLIYIILALIILSIVVAIFISKQLNKPILNLISNAKELSKGNYKVKFNGGNVAELEELADVLTVAASEMDKTDELRRDLIANVSHDLKTPLTMIKAYAEKVRDLSYKDPEKRNKDLNVIIDESDRLNGLVNDLLELSKLQAHEENLSLIKYDLVDEVKEVMRRYDVVCEKDHYVFKLDLPESAIVFADKDKIDQVLYNLINNALEHTGDDLNVYISVIEKKNSYLVSIKDTGKGISKDEIPLVWNRYYTKKKNYKRNHVGTGIGLSIVKGVLEKHKFIYGIDSKVNQYTTFYFEMPKYDRKKNK